MNLLEKYYLTFFLAFAFFIPNNYSQNGKIIDDPDNIYDVNRWVSAGVVAGGNIVNYLGQDRIRKKAAIPIERILKLNKSDVPGFDRWAVTQNDISKYKDALDLTDVALIVGPAFPLILGLDKKIRKDWLDVFLVYAEAQTAVANFYAWGPSGPTIIERLRPITYYDEIPEIDRIWGGNKNSFYSGHVSTVAVGFYFTAQALMDAHPIMKKKAWLWYTVATIPPAYIGFLRIKGLKHFPSDIVAGLGVAFLGSVLIPKLHKKKNGAKYSVFSNRYGTGLYANISF